MKFNSSIVRGKNKKYLVLGLFLLISLPIIVLATFTQTNLLSRANRDNLPTAANKEEPPKPFVEVKERGLTWAGLKANENARCNNAFEMVDENGNFLGCTHGPDPAPSNVDVTESRDTNELIEAADSFGPANVPCVGDGESGARVQMFYAITPDKADRYEELLPLFNSWAGIMDRDLNNSAAKTGGERHIRYVTNSDCSLNVIKLILTTNEMLTFSAMVARMQALGYTQTNRRYIVWADATVGYCGIGSIRTDDSPNQDNVNNTRSGWARIDTGCWGRSDRSTELHELMHTIGAVQSTSPHASSGGHCSDDFDTMCSSLTQVCSPAETHERLLDCNNDDYFAVNPEPGSYLDTHWNTANSIFLSTEAIIPNPSLQAVDKLETENGFYKYPVQLIFDSASSMGKYIQF